ncbi:MAG: Trm112 family protein [Chloroflexota bacterium]
MKKLFRFLFTVAILGVIVYVVKNMIAPKSNEFASAGKGDGVMPTNVGSALDDKPLGGDVSEELLKILVCPEDKGALELVEGGTYLLNPRNGYRYPIRGGIPVMLIEEGKKNRLEESASPNGQA